jgi:hypothetical protein
MKSKLQQLIDDCASKESIGGEEWEITKDALCNCVRDYPQTASYGLTLRDARIKELEAKLGLGK